jgi:hypothetical protein
MHKLLVVGLLAGALAGSGCASAPETRTGRGIGGWTPEQVRRLDANDAAFAECVKDPSHAYNWCVDESNRIEQQIKEGQ